MSEAFHHIQEKEPAKAISPFVKWAGGKKQLLPVLVERMPSAYNRYYEPFIGGGALLLCIQPKNAVINDVNRQLLNVYRQLKRDPVGVVERLKLLDGVECDKEHYIEMRARFNRKIQSDELDIECAALMIWINKHCFNGLYRVNSKGLFNVPYNNRVNGASMSVDNLISIGKYLNDASVEIREGDFERACEDAEEGDFVYFDSPYIPESRTANFTDYTKDGFGYDDHCRLAQLFKKLSDDGVKVMLSNNDVGLIYELYNGFIIQPIDVRRSINSDASKRVGREVVVTNYER